MNHRGKSLLVLVFSLALLGAACGSDSTTADGDADSEAAASGDAGQNACPADGCTIEFAELAKAGDEIEVTWELNFDPDLNNNHIHIYWDIYEPGQVSNDATDRGLTQGEWVPTDVGPTYVTDGAASTSVRGDSTTLCVVAGDRDHNVINETAEVCRDVSEYLYPTNDRHVTDP